MKNQNFELYGLIGKQIAYSFSPTYFEKKFKALKKNAAYTIFDLNTIDEVKDVFYTKNLKGCNVTIPYKNEIIPFLDELDPLAEKLSAVNTIAFDNGRKIGFNTDIIGFRESLKPLIKSQHQKALILGNGGAASAVIEACHQLGLATKTVSRNPTKDQLSYLDLDQKILEEYKVIVNTTPLGSAHFPHQKPNIPYQFISIEHLCYDLIYNPEVTPFLETSKNQGAIIKNGLEMLELQAEASYQIWQSYSQLK